MKKIIRVALIPFAIALYAGECLAQTKPKPHEPAPRAAVEMKFSELRFGKPPLAYLYFDVTLRNDRSEPRWFLLPSSLNRESAPLGAKGGVDGLEVYAPQGEGRILVGRFFGTGGFQALLLPAGAEARLRLLPISYWGELPERLQVEVVLAKRLLIGGEPAESWFGTDALSSAKADIAERLMNPARITHARSTPDHREVATQIEADERLKLDVALSEQRKAHPQPGQPKP